MAKLSEEQQVIADRVQAAITATHPDGSFKYTKEECRAFIVACVLDLGLPLPTELEGVFGRFLDQIGVSQTAPEDEVVEAIKTYFKGNPLHPGLLAEIEGLSRAESIASRDDYDKEAATREAVARLRGTGQQQATRAPEAAAQKKAPPKVKKGLR